MGLYPQAWRMRLAATAARAGLPATMLGEGIVILSLLAAMAGTALAGLPCRCCEAAAC